MARATAMALAMTEADFIPFVVLIVMVVVACRK
jgi:hypothetical protein